MKENSPIVIFCYFFACIAILLSLYAFVSISLLPTKTIARQVLLYLHLSLIVEQIVLFPFVYTSNTTLCRITGFIHTYSGLSNVIAMWLITTYSINYIHCSFPIVDQFVYRWKEVLCFLFPLITIVPLIKNDYGEQNDAWCELTYLHKKNEESLVLTILFYYFWVWLFIVLSLLKIFYVVIDSARTGGFATVKSVLTNAGAYGIISLISWIPHTIRKIYEGQLSEQQDLGLTIPIYATGIFYGLLYIWKPSIVNLQDKPHVRDSTIEFKMSDLDSIISNPLGALSFGFRPDKEDGKDDGRDSNDDL